MQSDIQKEYERLQELTLEEEENKKNKKKAEYEKRKRAAEKVSETLARFDRKKQLEEAKKIGNEKKKIKREEGALYKNRKINKENIDGE